MSQELLEKRVAFIGAGAMGDALAAGLLGLAGLGIVQNTLEEVPRILYLLFSGVVIGSAAGSLILYNSW